MKFPLIRQRIADGTVKAVQTERFTMAEYWKAILAFLSLVATNVATQLMTAGVPWPTNGGEWVRFGVTTVAGTWLVYQKRNALTVGKHEAPDA